MDIFLVIFDIFMALIMYLSGFTFYKSRGKGCDFLSRYNMRSEEERKKYDENAMCRTYGKNMMLMAAPFIIGAVLDVLKPGMGCILAWIIWIIQFLFLMMKRTKLERGRMNTGTHLDEQKAFGKDKKTDM